MSTVVKMITPRVVVPITIEGETIYAIKTEGDYSLYNLAEDGEYVKQNTVLRNIGQNVYVRVCTHHFMALRIVDGVGEVLDAQEGFYLDFISTGAVRIEDGAVIYYGFSDGGIPTRVLYPVADDYTDIEHVYTRRGKDVTIVTAAGLTLRYTFGNDGSCVLDNKYTNRVWSM